MKKQGGETYDRNPFIGRHFLPYEPAVTQMCVDHIQIFRLVDTLIDLEIFEEFLIRDVLAWIQWIFEVLSNTAILLIQGGNHDFGRFAHYNAPATIIIS